MSVVSCCMSANTRAKQKDKHDFQVPNIFGPWFWTEMEQCHGRKITEEKWRPKIILQRKILLYRIRGNLRGFTAVPENVAEICSLETHKHKVSGE